MSLVVYIVVIKDQDNNKDNYKQLRLLWMFYTGKPTKQRLSDFNIFNLQTQRIRQNRTRRAEVFGRFAGQKMLLRGWLRQVGE